MRCMSIGSLTGEGSNMANSANRTCQVCGGEITPEQISKKEAGLLKGILHCPNCVAAKRAAAAATPAVAAASTPAAATATAIPRAAPVAEEPISLVDTGGDES